MTQVPARCPQCDATMGLFSTVRHSRCSFCGCRFVVDWSDPATPRLTGFEDIIKSSPGVAPQIAAAHVRDLESAATSADAQIEASREQAKTAAEAHERKVRSAQRAIAAPQSRTLAAGMAAALVVFLVAFVVEDALWYLGLVLSALLVLLTRMAYRRWQGTESQALAGLEESRQVVQQAQNSLEESLAIQDDRRLEQELWQARAAAGSSGGASGT